MPEVALGCSFKGVVGAYGAYGTHGAYGAHRTHGAHGKPTDSFPLSSWVAFQCLRHWINPKENVKNQYFRKKVMPPQTACLYDIQSLEGCRKLPFSVVACKGKLIVHPLL